MEILRQKGLLKVAIPLIQTQRFRGKINIQRPRAPHFDRALVNALTQPKFVPMKIDPIVKCQQEMQKKTKALVAHPYQKIIANECRNWFDNSKMVAIFHLNPMDSDQHFKLEIALRKHNMYSKRYGKETIKIAFEGTGYNATLPLFESHSIIVFSTETQVAKLLKAVKKFPQIILLGGIIEDRFLNKDDFVQYGNLPDLQTARASLGQVLLSSGSQITRHLNHHQNILVRHLDTHIEEQNKLNNKE